MGILLAKGGGRAPAPVEKSAPATTDEQQNCGKQARVGVWGRSAGGLINMPHEETIRELIHAVRRRWATLRALRAAATGAVSVAIVSGAALLLALGTHGAPRALAIIAVAALVLSIAAVIRASWTLR